MISCCEFHKKTECVQGRQCPARQAQRLLFRATALLAVKVFCVLLPLTGAAGYLVVQLALRFPI